MKCGRPWPLWAPTAEGVFRAPRRSQGRGASVARARGADCKGAEDRPCSAGARGDAGAASSRRWTASGREGAVSGGFIGRGGEVRGTHAGCLRGGVHGAAASAFTVDGFCLLHRARWRGARDSRRLPARWRSRCGGFGLLHRARVSRCAGLTPAACAAAFTVRPSGRGCAVSNGFVGRCGARCAGLAPTACAAGLTVPREWAHRWAFRSPKSARAAIAAPRPRRHRPVHGHGHGAPHRPRGCSTAQPGC